MDLVPYAVPFFLLAIGLEYAWGRARGNDTYRLNDSINSLSCGILSTSIKLLGLDIGGRAAGGDSACPGRELRSRPARGGLPRLRRDRQLQRGGGSRRRPHRLRHHSRTTSKSPRNTTRPADLPSWYSYIGS